MVALILVHIFLFLNLDIFYDLCIVLLNRILSFSFSSANDSRLHVINYIHPKVSQPVTSYPRH